MAICSTFNAGLFFANQLRRLADSNIRVFIVRGNHDAMSKISKAVPLPKNVHVFKSSKPETIIDKNIGFAIHGQSFATGVITDDLAAQYTGETGSLEGGRRCLLTDREAMHGTKLAEETQ